MREEKIDFAEKPFLPRCAAMAVGSLPHDDVDQALNLVAETTPEVPAWPQLPRRSFLENMYAQFSEGMPGLIIDQENQRLIQKLEIADEELLEFVEAVESHDPKVRGRFGISKERAAGLHAFADLLSRLSPPPQLVKGQITGPVSFCLQVTDEGKRPILYNDTIRELALEMLMARARWQREYLQTLAPHARVIIMIDEPFLTQWGSGYLSMPEDIVVDLLERMVQSLTGCVTGIHVCGGTDWSRVTALPLDLLNFDAADHLDALLAHAESVARFVAKGGWLAWGAVPNDERAQVLTAEEVAEIVEIGAVRLAETGLVSEAAVYEQSLVTPACGTGSLPVPLAEACLKLAAATSMVLRARHI